MSLQNCLLFGVTLLVVICFLFVPTVEVFAQGTATGALENTKNPTYVPVVNIPGLSVGKADPVNFLRQLFLIGLTLTAFLAVVMIMWGGIQYMTTDAVSGKSEGKTRIRNAIFGLLIALLFLTVLGTINPQLTQFKFNVSQVQLPQIFVPQSTPPPSDYQNLANKVSLIQQAKNNVAARDAELQAAKKKLDEAKTDEEKTQAQQELSKKLQELDRALNTLAVRRVNSVALSEKRDFQRKTIEKCRVMPATNEAPNGFTIKVNRKGQTLGEKYYCGPRR